MTTINLKRTFLKRPTRLVALAALGTAARLVHRERVGGAD
jgi:hypothetical protein